MKLTLACCLGFALAAQRTLVDEIARQRAIRGIAPVASSKPLEAFLAAYLRKDRATETSSVAELLGETACATFLDTEPCYTQPASDFLAGAGVAIFSLPAESNVHRQMDRILASEKHKIVFNRQDYACTPFRAAASVEYQGSRYILLSPLGPSPAGGYRPVDFPSQACAVEGMDAFTVPPGFSQDVHEFYSQLNVDMTRMDIKPLMFSALLSADSVDESMLLCSSVPDAACLDEPGPVSVITLSLPKSVDLLGQVFDSAEYGSLVNIPAEDSWRHWRAVGISVNATHVDFRFATNHALLPELMNGVCKEPCIRHFVD